MFRAINTRSGSHCAVSSSASSPFSATPTTAISRSRFSSIRSPSRVIALSSQISTRGILHLPFDRQLNRRALPRGAVDAQLAAGDLRPLAYAGQPKVPRLRALRRVESTPIVLHSQYEPLVPIG